MKYIITSYYDSRYCGLESQVELSNLSDAESLAWSKLQNGLFVIIDCGDAYQRFNPDFIDPLEYQELDDLLEESRGNMWPSQEVQQ